MQAPLLLLMTFAFCLLILKKENMKMSLRALIFCFLQFSCSFVSHCCFKAESEITVTSRGGELVRSNANFSQTVC